MNKKKITKTIAFALSLTLMFAVGRMTAPTRTVTETITETEYVTVTEHETIDEFMYRIVDFNTDGNELSVMLNDGTELYAYRDYTNDHYKGNRVIAVKNGIVYLKNGRQYSINE